MVLGNNADGISITSNSNADNADDMGRGRKVVLVVLGLILAWGVLK